MKRFKTLKIYTLYTLLCLVLFSCADKQTRCYVCEQSESLQVADFVSKNIKDANNMSDEEGTPSYYNNTKGSLDLFPSTQNYGSVNDVVALKKAFEFNT